MYVYDKDEIKQNLSIDQIFNYLEANGGEPEYTSFGIISSTICHNLPYEGSRKLYYYSNTNLFRCYTGCNDTFDIFELEIKIQEEQKENQINMGQAVIAIAHFFGISPEYKEDQNQGGLKDWEKIAKYEKISNVEIAPQKQIKLEEYDKTILSKLRYPAISIWEKEGISPEVIKECGIGYYPTGEQISIPHYDINGRFIGLRGRALITEEAELYGKYRPLNIAKTVYRHPLGLNLYNLNHSKEYISKLRKAIIFEGKR